MMSIGLILLAYFCGALPFSVWLGKIFLGLDIRQIGDGNPGSTNVFKAGNSAIGIIALVFDISKAAVPVGLAYFNLHIRGWTMFLIAVAPILGHVFSPFLGFRGGKALATAFGVWIGLTIWLAPLPGAVVALLSTAIITPRGWSIMLAMGAILIILLIWLPDRLLLWIWLAETLILIWTHRIDLGHRPKLRSWLAKIFLRAIV
jgi:glycerol-3-phosphate acyltransferase PlsY